MRHKLTAALLAALMMPALVMADSYDTLWKQARQAQEKDLPREELAITARIAEKARNEKAYGQLLAAETRSVAIWETISPDSLAPRLGSLEREAGQARAADPALYAVYMAVLHKAFTSRLSVLDSAAEKAATCAREAMANAALLASLPSKSYEPLVKQGIDGAIFRHDLLHVIGFETGAYRQMLDYYSASGNRAAACVTAGCWARAEYEKRTVKDPRGQLARIDSLISEYADLPEAGELAIERYQVMCDDPKTTDEEKVKFIDRVLERWGTWKRMNTLRNAKEALENPMFTTRNFPRVFRPGQPVSIVLDRIRHIRRMTLTVSKLDITAETSYDPNDKKDYAQLQKLLSPKGKTTLELDLPDLPAYEVTKDSFLLAPLPLGAYLVEIKSDREDMEAERAIIYVSDMAVISQALPGRRARLVVVSATSGQAVAGATIVIGDRDDNARGRMRRETVLTTDSEGEAVYTYSNDRVRRWGAFLYAYSPQDTYTPPTWFNDSFSYTDDRKARKQERLYTDRSIYRPGQTVRVTVIRYEQAKGTETRALRGEKVTLTLLDANREAVGTREVTTDGYGTAWADFTLPRSGLTGDYTVRTDLRTGRLVKVEEYKRPTFEVTFPEVKRRYEAGDTLVVSGTARTYAGMPVGDAKVRYQVTRRPTLWCWWARGEAHQQVYADTLTTDSEGNFEVRIPLVLPAEDANSTWRRVARFYDFVASADVTDRTGESHHGELSIPLGSKPAAFNTDLPGQAEKDSLRHFTFIYKNASGHDVAAKVRYRIDRGEELAAETNRAIEAGPLVRSLPSGKHTLEAVCGEDTLRHDFVVFTLEDTRPATPSDEWFYQNVTALPADGKPLYTQVGSSRDSIHAVYTIISGNQVLEQGSYALSDSIVTRAFTYRESYGNGLVYNVAWIKDGRLHYHSFTMPRPLPDKRLNVEWTTFRDRLTPGQKEEWTLRVTNPDGTPAKAQLMGVLYDKSLDQLYPHQWHMNLYLQTNLPFSLWRSNLGISGNHFLAGSSDYHHKQELLLDFDLFDSRYFPKPRRVKIFYAIADGVYTRGYAMASQAELEEAVVIDKAEAPMMMKRTAAPALTMGNAGGSGAETEEGTGENTQLRENLQETAFFYPNLETDENGNVAIRFTLPESVTTWRMMGIAHDEDMRNGTISGEVVASKEVMILPNMPRFLRQGDKAILSTRLSNNGGKEAKGKARMELIDPFSMKTLYEEEQDFRLAGAETRAVSFSIHAQDLPAITICRVTASGKGFSDGEQHYLPILPDKERVINTLPLVYHQAGRQEIDLSTMVPEGIGRDQVTYSLEYTRHPAWMMVQALPSVSQPDGDNAISLVSAYYANGMASYISRSVPHLKTVLELWKHEPEKAGSLGSELEKNDDLRQLILTETPWVMEADKETSQRQRLVNYLDSSLVNHRLATQYEKLSDLQLADGSFSWWKGMQGSRYMTTAVAMTLARLQATIGPQANNKRLMEKAIGYLKKEAHREVTLLREKRRKGNKEALPSEDALNYLYIIGIDHTRLTASEQEDRDYLLSLVSQRPTVFSIYGKARYATVLALLGEKAKAREYLRSLKEYTVYRDDIGRYFDTRDAGYSWRDYRIPSEVAAIEALQLVTPEDTKTIEEMRRWLLSCKRTQAWDTPINTVDAVYAFLEGNMSSLAIGSGSEDKILVDGTIMDTPQESAGLGYTRISLPAGSETLTIDKRTSQTSWGTLYASFEQPSTEVKATAAGISVKREIVSGTREVGQRIKIRLTVIADRDYDFVAITDKRAACLEPVNGLSGYRDGYYVAPRDNATYYYLNQLRKGKLVIEEEYYIDRLGAYTQGTCQAECAYSTAFRGIAPGETIISKSEVGKGNLPIETSDSQQVK